MSNGKTQYKNIALGRREWVYADAAISKWVGRKEGLSLVQLLKQGEEAAPMRTPPKRLDQQLSSTTPDAELATLL